MTPRSTRDDGGSALLVAIMAVGVCIAISLIGVRTALTATRGSGVDRQRVLAVNAAEAGLDSAFVTITDAGLQPPCAVPTTDVRSGPDRASYTTSISYVNAAGTALPCDATGSVTGVPASALIRSTATTNVLGGGNRPVTRAMEAQVNLVQSKGLTRAMMADGTINFTNKTTLTGNDGADADVYTNKDFICANNENFAGDVYSQKDITISNACTFAGDLWAGGQVTTSGGSSGSVGGFVKAGGGIVNLSNVTVTGNLYASGAITYGGCSTPGKCFPNSSPGLPPTLPFPIIRGDAATLAAWTAAPPTGGGYTLFTDNSDCSGLKTRIIGTYAKKGFPTLVSTTCAVSFSGDKDIVLNNDLAIFATGGFTSSNQVSFLSNVPGTTRQLHWIVPATDASGALVTRPCSSPGINTDQHFGIGADVAMFVYSPCDIAMSNNSMFLGQIYGGSSVTINNQFNLTYRPMSVFGVDSSSLPVSNYTPSIVFKREAQ